MTETGKLKMRFKLHQLEFEIEGNQETVKEQFDNFKSFITNDLLPKINVATLQTSGSIQDEQTKLLNAPTDITDTVATQVDEVPALKQVILLDLPKSETDWILIYACYATSFGQETFTEDIIKASYEQSGRSNRSRLANLSNNIKSLLNKQLIKVHNDSEYLIKPEGIKYAYEILNENSSSRTSAKKANKSGGTKSEKKASTNGQARKGTSSNSLKLDRQLNLRPEDKESLRDFAAKYQIDSTPKQILVIVYYLKEVLGLTNVNSNHIYTGLDELNVRIPDTLDIIISNTKNRNGWLDFESKEDIGLSVQGRNAIKHDLILGK